MKSKWIIGLTVGMMIVARTCSAGVTMFDVPGTPTTNWDNPGGTVVSIFEGGGIGVQPLLFPVSTNLVPFTAQAGDIVFLANPGGGNNSSNWAAVLTFFNPSDPTGINALAATDYQTFSPANAGPGGFASFALFPNTVFLPEETNIEGVVTVETNVAGTISTFVNEFGPDGGILSGQLAIITYTASPQSVPEPSTVALVGLGVAGLAVGAWRRRKSVCKL
jgi:hypothetical protein